MGRAGKPISAIEKRQRRAMEEERKKRREREKRAETTVREPMVAYSIVNKIRSEIRNLSIVTPFIIAQRYSLSMSAAKAVLRILYERGDLELYDHSRRLSIYIPKSK
mgnify:CR=1 FL=1